MNFSIIIVSYNTEELLKHCLDSIFDHFEEKYFEVIVVDNNSSDKSIDMLQEYGTNVKVVKNNRNVGFGIANNQGAKITKGKYLFFLNSDTIINNNILSKINNYLIENDSVGVVSPKLLLKNGIEQAYAYGLFPDLKSLVFKNLKCNSREIDWVSGAAMIIRKDIFNKINGFDENFFMYFEDIDLCKRVRGLGYKIIYFNQVSLTHLGGGSQKRFLKIKKEYYKSQNYYYKKHFGFFVMLIMRIIRFPYKIIIFLFSKFNLCF